MRFLILLLALASPLVFIALASAHAAPERFDPSPGAVLKSAPQQVDGWFIQDVRRQADASFIKVFDAGGMQLDDKSPVVDDMDRRHMSVKLESGLGAGRYMVAWETLSDEDDELDGGCFWFFVGQEAADKAHEEKLRINAPDGCPINLEEASALFTKPDNPSTSISIDMPSEVDGSEVTVNFMAEGVTIQPPTGSGRDPKFGHYHIYLDQIPVLQHSHGAAASPESGSMGMTAGAASATPDYSKDIMVVSDSYTLKNLAPGHHVLTAALFYDDHTPFDPTVMQSVTFTVKDGESGGGTGAATVIIIAIAAGAAGLLAGGGLAWGRRRR